MRFSWLVIAAFSACGLIGCAGVGPLEDFGEAAPIAGCDYLKGVEARKFSTDAEKYFLAEVGTKISSLRLGRPSDCKEKIVVPVAAVTAHSNVPRIWFVEIRRDSGESSLIRPD